MQVLLAIAVALMVCASARSAEPPSAAKKAAKPAPAASAPAPTARAATPPVPLKLQVGDVRKYMMPNEFIDALTAADAERTTIIVQGDRPIPKLKSEQPLPQGFGAYYSLFRHPDTAWRLFLPDPNGVAAGPPSPVPEREFRWGP
jgi:hypothetical protein